MQKNLVTSKTRDITVNTPFPMPGMLLVRTLHNMEDIGNPGLSPMAVCVVVVVLILYCHDGPWPIRHNE